MSKKKVKEEITEEEVQAVAEAITEEAKEQDKSVNEIVDEIIKEQSEDLPVITLDNQPVDPIVIEQESEEVPKELVPTKPIVNVKAKHNIYNGRVYKVLNNGRGMYADNGETFDLSLIK